MNQLAEMIRTEMDSLVQKYDRRLREIESCALLPGQDRLDAAKQFLSLIALCLESRDSAPFLQFIQEWAGERKGKGNSVESLLEALTALEGVLLPLISTTETATFLWSALSQAKTAASQQIAAARKELERQFQGLLERRERQVQLSTHVAQEIAAAADLHELYLRVVNQVKEQFGYYYAQLLRYDPAAEMVVLVAGSGDTGEQMLAQGHRLALGTGLVGTAAATGESVLRPDITADPDWRPNPLLPETRGELAVPIKLGRRVLGVLDIQSSIVDALDAEDQLVLEGLCGQIAVAMESTSLRQEMQENLHELRVMQQVMSREGWEAFRETGALPQGYLFDQAAIQPAVNLWLPEIELAARQKTLVSPTSLEEIRTEDQPGSGAAVAPMLIQNEMIGVLGVYEDPERPLSSSELALIESVSEQVAQALEGARLFAQTQATLAETELLYQASADLNTARSYDEVLAVLRRYTVIGQGSQNISINYFDRPWTGEDRPAWVETLARWSQLSKGAVERRYPLSQFPAAQKLLRSDEPTLIEDVLTDRRMSDSGRMIYSQRFGAKSTIFVPLTVGGQWLGFVNAIYQQPTHFSEAAVRRLMTLVGQAAVAVQTLQLLEQMKETVAESQALYYFGEMISREPDLQAVYNAVARLLVEELGYAGARVLQLDEGAQVMWEVADSGAGINDEIARSGISLAESHNPLVMAIQERQIKVFNKPRQDERLAAIPEEVKAAVGKLAATPIFIGGKFVGAIAANRPLEAADISERDERLLNAVATQTAIAAQRAQLFTETQEALAAAENLYEAGQRISAAGNLQEVVAAVAEGRPSPVIDRINLFTFERDVADEVEAVTVAAAWQSGEEMPPLVVGTRISRSSSGGIDMLTPAELTFFNNIEHDERVEGPLLEILRSLNIRSMVILPLWVGARQIGVLTLEAGELHRFTEREVQPYLSLAPQVAVAVDNQRLLAETQAALADVEALQRRYTLQAWETYMNQRRTQNYEQLREGVTGLSGPLPPEAEQAIASKKTWVSGMNLPNGHQVVETSAETVDKEASSSLVVPLTLRGEIIGVLGLQDTDERQWSPEEVALVEAISKQLAQAAESIRLIDETQQRAAHEAKVNEIGEKIQAAHSLDEALKIAIQEVGRSLNAPQTTVRLEVKQG